MILKRIHDNSLSINIFLSCQFSNMISYSYYALMRDKLGIHLLISCSRTGLLQLLYKELLANQEKVTNCELAAVS